jgi:hypothetical protein
MKRMYLIGLAVLLLCGMSYAERPPIYPLEKTLSHTIVITDMDSTHANGHPWSHLDTLVLGPVFIDPLANGWKRSIFVDQDSIFAGDTLQVIFQTSPYKGLTNRTLTTSRALGWMAVDSAQIIPAADTLLNFSPFLTDSLGTTAWNQAIWARVIVRVRTNFGFVGRGASGDSINTTGAADSAIVGNTYTWKLSYFMIPMIGGSRNTY